MGAVKIFALAILLKINNIFCWFTNFAVKNNKTCGFSRPCIKTLSGIYSGLPFEKAAMTPFEILTVALTLLLVVIGIITVVLMAFQAGRGK